MVPGPTSRDLTCALAASSAGGGYRCCIFPSDTSVALAIARDPLAEDEAVTTTAAEPGRREAGAAGRRREPERPPGRRAAGGTVATLLATAQLSIPVN